MAEYTFIAEEDLGVEHGEAEYAFRYFGAVIRVHPEFGELSYVEFMAKATEVDEEDIENGLPLLMAYLKDQVHPDDWDEFFKLAKSKRQTTKDLMELSNKILGVLSGFPTEPQDDLSPTPSSGELKSKDGSSAQAVNRRAAHHRKSAAKTVEHAMHLLEGRPDLQMAVLRAQEARS